MGVMVGVRVGEGVRVGRGVRVMVAVGGRTVGVKLGSGVAARNRGNCPHELKARRRTRIGILESFNNPQDDEKSF